MDAGSWLQQLEQGWQLLAQFFATKTGQWVATLGLLVALYVLVSKTAIARRAWKALEETMFANWQLALLGTTGIVLSAASGWTTWDGMRNFTGEPILSAMVTFGIQGVMLIVAWLIGESFASGMNRRRPEGGGSRLAVWAGAILGVGAALVLFAWTLQSVGAVRWPDTRSIIPTVAWSQAANLGALFAMAMIVVALIAMNSRSDIAAPYVQTLRIIARNLVLWVMFLACMATSVFFSFDSLFTAIFPQQERARAADLRAQNQIAGLIADIDETIRTRRVAAVEDLFASEAWKTYDGQLLKLAAAALASTQEIEKFFNDQIEGRNRAVKEQQERIATSQSTQAGLTSRKTTLVEELTRLKSERGTLAADYTEKQTELESRIRAVDAKRVEAIAEEKGAEGTLKQGRGPQYRQIQAELAQLQAALKIQEDRVRDAQKRLQTTDGRITQLEREAAALDGDLAKLKGEAQTAEQRIRLMQEQGGDDPAARVDPARVLPAFEAARAEFRQQPDAQRLMKLQQQCTQVVNAMLSTEVTKPRVRGIDCDPKQAAEAAAVVFALDTGGRVFAGNCIGGEKLAPHQTADALFGFARKCLSDSGLPSRETDQLRTKINFAELNRDDKAHRFVVTWNAFQDGNRLAYLALAIAIAIDSLVFMSGLFGANALRSPLSDLPSDRARSASQLEAIIDTALIPHKFDTARLVLGAMRPMSSRDGFMASVEIHDGDPHAQDLRRVLSAGATIGAVRHADRQPNVYEIRAELFEYLSQVAKREFEQNPEHVNLADLERTVSVALLPDIGAGANTVLSFLHPIHEQHGFMAEIKLAEVGDRAREDGQDIERAVRSALNAGAMYQRVQRAGDGGHYYIHADFYKVLVKLRARMMSGGSHRQISQEPARRSLPGGALKEARPSLGAQIEAQRLTDQTQARAQADVPPSEPVDAHAALEAWERHCGDILFGALNLDRETAAARLEQASVRNEALAAWKQLNVLAGNNSILQDFLDDHRQDQERLLGEAYSQLRSDARGRVPYVQVLDDLHDMIGDNLYVILLSPENGLIESVIEQIERAAHPDDGLIGGEQVLKDRLVEIRERMQESDLGRPDTWQGVTEAFRKLAHDREEFLKKFSPRRGDA